MTGQQCRRIYTYYSDNMPYTVSDKQAMYPYYGHSPFTGTKDVNGNWLKPSGEYSTFVPAWPNVSGYYPLSSTEINAPFNSPCPKNSYKNLDGECVSGVVIRGYNNYETAPPNVYGAILGQLKVDIAGITNASNVLQPHICEALNGSYKLQVLDAIQSETFYNQYTSYYYGYNDSINNDGGSGEADDLETLDFLGYVVFNDENSAEYNWTKCGYDRLNLYLMLAGDDPIQAADGVSHGSMYVSPTSSMSPRIVYRGSEVDVKPKIWLIAEFLSTQHAAVIFPSGGPPGLWGSVRRGATDGNSVTHGELMGQAFITPGSCRLVFGKPIADYNGDYIVTERPVWIDAYTYVPPGTVIKSLAPYHPRCDNGLNNYNYIILNTIGIDVSGFGYAGDFDGENIDINVSFSEDDLIIPVNKMVSAYATMNQSQYIAGSSIMDLPCDFNFNLHIYKDENSSIEDQVDNFDLHQAIHSIHLAGTAVNYCDHSSTSNKVILGTNTPLSYDTNVDQFYCHNTYNPSRVVNIYESDPISMPFGSFARHAYVTIDGVKQLPPSSGVDYHYRDCTDCTDLNGSYKLSFIDTPNPYINLTTTASTPASQHFAYILPNSVCCPCGSGLCARVLQLIVHPHVHETGIYPRNEYGPIYSTEVTLNILKVESTAHYSNSYDPIVAQYSKVFDNIWLIPSGYPTPSGRWVNDPLYESAVATTRIEGVIIPLPISSFQNLTLNFVSGDMSYINTVPQLPGSGFTTACDLPNTVTVSLFEPEEYMPQPILYTQHDPMYATLSRAAQYAYVTIPNSWSRSFTTRQKQSDGTYCTETHTVNTCDIGIWSSNWYGEPLPTCLQAYQCAMSQLNYYSCFVTGMQGRYFYIRTTTSYYDCENPDNDRTYPIGDDPYVSYCGEYSSLDLCDQFTATSDEMPQGTYACKLQAYTDIRYGEVVWPSTLDKLPYPYNYYDQPLKDFMDCGTGAMMTVGTYMYYQMVRNSWKYFTDPCNGFLLQPGANTYFPPDGLWHCTAPTETLPYEFNEWTGLRGIQCDAKIQSIDIGIGLCSYGPISDAYYAEYSHPLGQGMCRISASITFVCRNIYGGTPFFISDFIPTISVGACGGVSNTVLIDVDAIQNITLYPWHNSWFMVGSFYWPPDKGISLTLS